MLPGREQIVVFSRCMVYGTNSAHGLVAQCAGIILRVFWTNLNNSSVGCIKFYEKLMLSKKVEFESILPRGVTLPKNVATD